jgi:hypothetical protein
MFEGSNFDYLFKVRGRRFRGDAFLIVLCLRRLS